MFQNFGMRYISEHRKIVPCFLQFSVQKIQGIFMHPKIPRQTTPFKACDNEKGFFDEPVAQPG